jgi:hypothetical protein
MPLIPQMYIYVAWCPKIPLEDFAVVTAEYQSNGRGQRATKWAIGKE